jgi:uncharacterized protein (DUF983 family)
MTNPRPLFFLSLRRAISRHCPNCGKSPLFRGYLKQVEFCASCGEEFGHIRADDGPAWLTILLVGHILAPFLLFMAIGNDWPDWVAMTIWPSIAVILMLIILPFAKGAFIGLIWRAGCIGSEKG